MRQRHIPHHPRRTGQHHPPPPKSCSDVPLKQKLSAHEYPTVRSIVPLLEVVIHRSWCAVGILNIPVIGSTPHIYRATTIGNSKNRWHYVGEMVGNNRIAIAW
jgi:hypothetical protein